MTLLPDEIIKGLLLLLAKGAGWLTLCGLIRWTLPAIKLSWRLALSSLILLTIAGLLPALWTCASGAWSIRPLDCFGSVNAAFNHSNGFNSWRLSCAPVKGPRAH